MQVKTAPTAIISGLSGIEVLRVKHLSGYGNLKAFVDIQIGALEIHSLRVIQQPGQCAYISMPQVEYQHDGIRRYVPVIRVHDKTLKEAIQSVVLEKWKMEDS